MCIFSSFCGVRHELLHPLVIASHGDTESVLPPVRRKPILMQILLIKISTQQRISTQASPLTYQATTDSQTHSDPT